MQWFYDGYTYQEYKALCDRYREVQLPGLDGLRVDLLLSGHLFSIAMNRVKTDKKSIRRRLLATAFAFPFEKTTRASAKTAFVFTGDAQMRPDYIRCLQNVAQACTDVTTFVIDLKNPKFSLGSLVRMPRIFRWARALNRVTHNKAISLDLAISLHRSMYAAKKLWKDIRACGCHSLVTFCDQWSMENALTQLASQKGMHTATLQHGNGNEIFAGFCSDFYLCNSVLSKNNAISCGIPAHCLVVAGPMKYAGQTFLPPKQNDCNKIGIVFDGLDNFENNCAMLNAAHTVAAQIGATCYIRFHPSNDRAAYADVLQETDIVCDDLEQFESEPTVYLMYISTMYTDLLYKRKTVFRYDNGKVTHFSALPQVCFSDAESLGALLATVREDYDTCLAQQQAVYDAVYGAETADNEYAKFFEEWRREEAYES